MTTTTRYVGNCQICEGDQKLHDGRMVHHGYKRPGDGVIHGDCPGVDQVPYEVSCDLVKKHIVDIRAHVDAQNKFLGQLRAGNVKELYVHDWRRGSRSIVRLVAGSPEAIEVDIQHSYKPRWEHAVEVAISHTESDIRHARFEIDRCTRRVAAWKPLPIRTLEEEQAKDDAAKAERKAVRDAARAAKAAKEAATKAKQEALKAKRRAVQDDFENTLRALAASDQPLAERQLVARNVVADLRMSKYRNWLSKYDLRCEDAIIALGLAEFDGARADGRPYLKWRA